MLPKLIYSPSALADMEEARDWLDEQREGLGNEFLGDLEERIAIVARSPELFGVVRGGYRLATLSRFRYAVVYEYDGEVIRIVGVIHTSRGPAAWEKRLR